MAAGKWLVRLLLCLALLASPALAAPRARDLGFAPGIFATGPLNAITDVEGVRVGHVTRIEGATLRSGVTAILPHPGNPYADKVPAGLAIANGFGKFAGVAQIAELGEIETPILLTNTLSVPAATSALIDWTLALPGNADVKTVNPVVGETNDRDLNDIRARRLTPADGLAALAAAKAGPVAEGSVGAGTGTMAFGWKGGIGTSSRLLPAKLGNWRVGVLVQANFGGNLVMDGLRVGKRLGRYLLQEAVPAPRPDGSIIIIIATDAPLSDRNLTRLARRSFAGLARTGAAFSNGSGDFALAFSTAEAVRRTTERRAAATMIADLPNDLMTPLFMATAEATEEAILNALVAATTVTRDPAGGEPGFVGEALGAERLKALQAKDD
jgi:D-aminopeptidase